MAGPKANRSYRQIALLPIAVLLMGAAGPAGCTPNLSPAGLHAVCSALVGPIRYNTYTKTSGWYAGSDPRHGP